MKSLYLGTVIVSMALTACSFAPKYQRPSMPMSAHFKEDDTWKRIHPGALKPADPLWWSMYGDSTLNALENKLAACNQSLQAALARYQEARANLQIARSALYPHIEGVGNGERQNTSATVANPVRHRLFNDFSMAGVVNYELDVWGRVRESINVSKNEAKATAADTAAIALSLQGELAVNYFTLRSTDEMQTLLDRTVNAYQKAWNLVHHRYKEGMVPVVDLDNATFQLENAKTQATNNRLVRAQLEHAIAVLVGEPPAQFSLKPARVPMKRIIIAPNLPSTLLERRPDIAAEEFRMKAANASIGVAVAGFFPNINLLSVVGFQSASLSEIFKRPSLIWSLGPGNILGVSQPMARAPIFEGGQLLGELKYAKSSYYETVANWRQTVLTAFQEVEDNLVAVSRLDQEIISQTAAVVAAQKALRQAQYQYQEGLTTFLNVVISEDIALQSEIALTVLRNQRQTASVRLVKSLGGGWNVRTDPETAGG